MIDLFDIPDQRELPDAVRQQARTQILAALRAEERPHPVRAMVPISIAAAAVVVLAGGAVAFLASGHQPTGQRTPPAEPTQRNATGMIGYTSPHQIYRVRDHAAPADQNARCKAQAGHEPAGTPGPAQWQPILTATANDVDVIAYQTPAGPVFCEVTPATVTLSAAENYGIPSNQVSFVTPFGSVAGMVNPVYKSVYVKPDTDPSSKAGLSAVVEGGVFVLPNAGPARATGTMTVSTGAPESAGPTSSNGRRNDNGQKVEVRTTTITDRTIPPVDQSSPAGRSLASCLAHAGVTPVVVPQAWLPGPSATLDNHETVQLGHYGDLLAVCETSGGQLTLDIRNGIDNGIHQPGTVDANPYVSTAQMFYDFRTMPGGVSGSDTVAIMGIAKSSKVAKVQISMPGKPTHTATVQNGTFLLTNMWIPNDFPDSSEPQTTVTALDANGAVLTTLTLR